MEISNQKLAANTKWEWSESISDYSYLSYKIKYILKSSTGTELSFESSGQHEIAVSKDSSAALPAGTYAWQAFAVSLTDSSETILIDWGTVEILADIDNTADSRTFTQKMVDNLRAAVLALSGKTMDSFSIDGRTYQYRDLEKIRKELEYWERKAGLSSGRRVKKISFE